MEKTYRIDSDFELIGGFWEADKPQEKFTGTLTSRRGDVAIRTSPIYAELDQKAAREHMRELFGSRMPEAVSSIHGFTTDKRCTILRPLEFSDGGMLDASSLEAVTAKRFEGRRTVMGLHIASADAAVLDGVAIHLTKIHHVLPSSWSLDLGSDKTTYEVPFERRNVFKFTSQDLDAEISCEVLSGGSNKLSKGARIKSIPIIKIMPTTSRSVDWLTSIGFRMENFFTLILGTSVEIKRIQVFRGEDSGWVVQKMRRYPEKFSYQMYAGCTSEVLAEALRRWLAVPEDKRAVEATFLQIFRKSKVYDETAFLSLSQALEGFGRIHFHPGTDKRTSFANFLAKIIALLSFKLARDLLGDPDVFIRKVVDTRNYLTHLGNVGKNSVVKTGSEMFLLNQVLHAFLRCAMLLNLGVPEENLRDPILYQGKRWRVV